MKKNLLLMFAISMTSSSAFSMIDEDFAEEGKQRPPHILTLVDYAQSILRQKTQPVVFPLSEEDKALINDMKFSIQPEQLKEVNAPWDRAAGMAANQWGVSKSIFLFCLNGASVKEPEVVINPSYVPLNDGETGKPSHYVAWEECFSMPLATGRVQRYTKLQVTYQNEEGEQLTKELNGRPARMWQHENDHLDGLLYDDPDAGKCVEKRNFSSKDEINIFFASLKTKK